jgi:LmbE family N-acetylglucosaminyl deacetylase
VQDDHAPVPGARAPTILADLARRAPVDAPVLLVAAHPDDETIGAGIAMAACRNLHLVHVTDGAPRDLADARAAGFATAAGYAAARRGELAAALAAGGVVATCHALDIPDQEASLHLPAIVAALTRLMRRVRPVAVIAHPYEGGHPDHDAAAYGAHRAAIHAGAPALLEMTSYHAAGDGIATGCFLPDPEPVVTLALDAAERARKRAMIAQFRSQGDVLAGFGVERECFRVAPRHCFAAPPHPGVLHYERHPGGMTGARGRALAVAADAALMPEPAPC